MFSEEVEEARAEGQGVQPLAVTCQHELSYCPDCDVVRCKKCGKKWGEKQIVYYPTPLLPYWQPTPSVTYRYVTTGGSTSGGWPMSTDHSGRVE